jgi:uncharacterized membrane protein
VNTLVVLATIVALYILGGLVLLIAIRKETKRTGDHFTRRRQALAVVAWLPLVVVTAVQWYAPGARRARRERQEQQS